MAIFFHQILRLFCLGLALVILPKAANAQYQKSALELQTDSLLANLRHQGVDTICIYKQYCPGCRGYWVADNSPCRTKGILIPTYIFWKQTGSTYGRKIDNCSLNAIQKLLNVAFWEYAFRYGTTINHEKIKPFVSLDHGMEYSLHIYTRNDSISQYFSGVNLVKRLKHPQKRNPYYRHNTYTHTAQLQEMLGSTARIFPQP